MCGDMEHGDYTFVCPHSWCSNEWLSEAQLVKVMDPITVNAANNQVYRVCSLDDLLLLLFCGVVLLFVTILSA